MNYFAVRRQQWQQQLEFSVAVLLCEALAVVEQLCVLLVRVVARQLYAVDPHVFLLQALQGVSAPFHVSVQLYALRLSFPTTFLAVT